MSGKTKHNGGHKARRYAGAVLTTFLQQLQVQQQAWQQPLF
jgi:hypothetical protein